MDHYKIKLVDASVEDLLLEVERRIITHLRKKEKYVGMNTMEICNLLEFRMSEKCIESIGELLDGN